MRYLAYSVSWVLIPKNREHDLDYTDWDVNFVPRSNCAFMATPTVLTLMQKDSWHTRYPNLIWHISIFDGKCWTNQARKRMNGIEFARGKTNPVWSEI